jgi:hypothetical protein
VLLVDQCVCEFDAKVAVQTKKPRKRGASIKNLT